MTTSVPHHDQDELPNHDSAGILPDRHTTNTHTLRDAEKAAEEPTHNTQDDIRVIDWEHNDPENPLNWTKTRKWIVTGTALFGTLILPLNGTSITVAAREINAQFGISDANFPHSYWPVVSWSVGGALFIIALLPLMEDLGVEWGYIITYAFFLLMLLPQMLAQNFETLIVSRFFSGGAVALLANTIASIIPDVWETDEARTIPVSLYILAYEVGNTLGPPMFARVTQDGLSWRWIFYIQLIIYGVLFPLFIYLIAETRGSVILRRRASRLRKRTNLPYYSAHELANNKEPLTTRLLKSSSRPIYLLFTEPVLLASTLWSAFSFGTVFLFTQSAAQVFTDLYGWADYSTAYVLGAVVIGECLGWFPTLYSSKLYLASASRNTENPGHPIPEARLYVSVFGSFVGITGGMFVYAWTSYPSVPWIAPAIGLGMVGFGIQVVVSAVADYITDAYAASDYAGSAISAVAFGENIFAGFLPLAAQSMYSNLGFQWASSLLGFLGLVLSFAPVIFIWKGRELRRRSPFMLSGGGKLNVESL